MRRRFARPGDMRHRVAIRRMERTPDGGGGYTERWVDVDTVWAQVEPLQGREQIVAMQTGMQSPHRFTIGHRRDVTGANELLYEGRRFDIQSVVDTDGAGRELVILAVEVP